MNNLDNISFKFSFYSVYNTGEGVAFDDIHIYNDPTLADETITKVTDIVDEKIFNVYPNPASTYVIIESEKVKGESLKILDISGKVVKHFKIQNSEFRIQIEDLDNGVYFIKIGTQVHKFIKK